jgi:molybdopterin molybdotransferase
MRTVEEHMARIRAAAVAPRPIRVAISEAQGLVCAEQVVTERPLPGFDQAAIDGYAVRSVDVADAGPDYKRKFGQFGDLTLPVVGDIRAGSKQPVRLQPRQAVRIEAGAPMPTLADAVVPFGWTDGGRTKAKILRPVRGGANMRRAGEDVQAGQVAVAAGTVIGPAQVGLLAAVGRERVLVNPRPRLAVISLGGELVDLDRTPGAGQVYDVNSYALAAAARDAGADVNRVGIAASNMRTFREVVESQLARSEIVVIAGAAGGSVADSVREALRDLGEIDIERVAMHPGSLQGFAQLGPNRIPTFLLPSNPVSALVIFEIMVRPLVRMCLGKRNPMRPIVNARTLAPITSMSGRLGFLRGQLMRRDESGEFVVQPLGEGNAMTTPPKAATSLLADFADANCLVLVASEETEIPAGEEVEVAFLAQRG